MKAVPGLTTIIDRTMTMTTDTVPLTGAERQRRYRAKDYAQGLKACTVMLPPDKILDVQLLAEILQANPYAVAAARDVETGRIIALRTPRRKK